MPLLSIHSSLFFVLKQSKLEFRCHRSFIHFINYVCTCRKYLQTASHTVSERRNVNQDFGQQETNLESIESTTLTAHRRASFAHRARLLHPRPIGNESVRLNNLSKTFRANKPDASVWITATILEWRTSRHVANSQLVIGVITISSA